MPRIKLTIERIKAATCPPEKQQVFIWDTDSPRLAVRITAGSKSFIFEGKLNRSTIRRTIGDVRVWTLADARKEANRLQGLLDQGIDPRKLDKEKREKEKADQDAREAEEKLKQARQKYTLRALCNAYLKYLEDQNKLKSAASAKSAFKCHLFTTWPELADTPANEVTSRQIAEPIRAVAESGKERTAGILRSYLASAYSSARRAPFDAKLPSSFIPFEIEQNPVEPIVAIRSRAGERHLNVDELKFYLSSLTDDLTDQALKLALYSGGQRMAQLLRAKVSDYDQEQKILRLFDTKGKRNEPRVHLLPLGPIAAGIVDNLVERAEETDDDKLFGSRGAVVHESTPGKRVKEISDTMKGEAFNLRDIRRTVETMMAGLGFSRDLRAQLLSHGISGVQSQHYDRHSYHDEKKSALLKWERHLKRIGTGKKAKKVVNLR